MIRTPSRLFGARCTPTRLASSPSALSSRSAAPRTPLARLQQKEFAEDASEWAASYYAEDVGRSLCESLRHCDALAASAVVVRTPLRTVPNETSSSDLLQPSSRKEGVPSRSRAVPQQHPTTKKPKPYLSAFHPGIARGWVACSHKLVHAANTLPTSRRQVWWRCAHCAATFKRAVWKHVTSNGTCPKCCKVPALHQTYPPLPVLGLAVPARSIVKRTSIDDILTPHKQTNKKQKKIARGRVLDSMADARSVSHALRRRNLVPMLAYSWQQKVSQLQPTDKVMVSPKLDGVRCVVAWDSRRRKVRFISRHGTLLQSCQHLAPQLLPLFAKDPTLVLDGELYCHDPNAFTSFEELCGVVRRSKSCGLSVTETAKKERQLEFHCFDIMHGARMNGAPFAIRYAHLTRLLQQLGRPQIVLVPSRLCEVRQVDTALRHALKHRYEGLMVRQPLSLYAHGKRTWNLLKYKKMCDDEFKIVGAVEGTGKWKRSLAAFRCTTRRGAVFHATPSAPDAWKRKMWPLRRSFTGQMVTVQYQEITPRGVPRFPVAKAVRGSSLSKQDWL